MTIMLFADSDTVQIVTAFIAFLGTMFTGVMAYKMAVLSYQQKAIANNVQIIEKATNSMKDALVESTRKESLATGELKGRADEKKENENRKEP